MPKHFDPNFMFNCRNIIVMVLHENSHDILKNYICSLQICHLKLNHIALVHRLAAPLILSNGARTTAYRKLPPIFTPWGIYPPDINPLGIYPPSLNLFCFLSQSAILQYPGPEQGERCEKEGRRKPLATFAWHAVLTWPSKCPLASTALPPARVVK